DRLTGFAPHEFAAAGVRAQRDAQVRQGLLELAVLFVDEPPIALGEMVVRVDPKRLVQLVEGTVIIALCRVIGTHNIANAGIPRSNPLPLLQVPPCGIEVALADIGGRPDVTRVVIVRLQPEHFAAVGDGAVEVVALAAAAVKEAAPEIGAGKLPPALS